jgi:hypothetical protein
VTQSLVRVGETSLGRAQQQLILTKHHNNILPYPPTNLGPTQFGCGKRQASDSFDLIHLKTSAPNSVMIMRWELMLVAVVVGVSGQTCQVREHFVHPIAPTLLHVVRFACAPTHRASLHPTSVQSRKISIYR